MFVLYILIFFFTFRMMIRCNKSQHTALAHNARSMSYLAIVWQFWTMCTIKYIFKMSHMHRERITRTQAHSKSSHRSPKFHFCHLINSNLPMNCIVGLLSLHFVKTVIWKRCRHKPIQLRVHCVWSLNGKIDLCTVRLERFRLFVLRVFLTSKIKSNNSDISTHFGTKYKTSSNISRHVD